MQDRNDRRTFKEMKRYTGSRPGIASLPMFESKKEDVITLLQY